MYYTYVLFCSKNGKVNSEFYVGSTEDLKNRLAEHNA
ncbi:MAG: GIY-YIG nuclease family protein [bacterium]|nr:GIY-YIG nuclease family protein [bacterium]